MLRNVAVLMSALVAMSAQAQDASTPKDEEKPAPAAPPAEGEQSPVVLAPRGPVESGPPVPSPSAPPAKADAEIDASADEEPNDCGMEQSFFDLKPFPMGVRSYKQPSPNPDEQQQGGWVVTPWVIKAGRCLQKYVIQVISESKKPWVVQDAKLVGSDGKLLKVTRSRPRKISQNVVLNTITAVRTEGVAEPDYMLPTILLIGKDGRAIALPSLNLP